MALKTKIFLGWFIFATIFTCLTLGNYLSDYCSGSGVPWFIGISTAFAINLWGCLFLKISWFKAGP